MRPCLSRQSWPQKDVQALRLPGITMAIEFNRRQIDTLEKTFFNSVRDQLEKNVQNVKRELTAASNPL